MATNKAQQGTRAERVKSLGIRTLRANSGLIEDIIDATVDRWIEGEDFDACLDAAQSDIADSALNRHGDKVRAAMLRAGLVIPDGELSAAAIAQAVQDKTGMDFGDFTPEDVLTAVDKMIAKQLSRYTGIEIDSVIGVSLTDAVKVGVRAALRSGTLNKLLGRVMERKARQAATLKRLGSTKVEYRKLRNRAYQAEWRKGHVQKWI